MANALAAREHAVHELLGLQLVAIALAAHLKPLHRVPGRVLQPQHVDAPNLLVARQHGGNLLRGVARDLELARQLHRVFNRQLGARANRKVRRVHRVAHQHHMLAVGVAQPPLLAAHPLKVQPRRAAQVARIGHQLVALQRVFEQVLAKRNARVLVGRVQPVCQPHVFRALHDEGGGVLVELVNVGLKPAVFGALKVESEGVVQPVGAQPDVAVGPHHNVGLEGVGVLGANARIDAVAGDDQVGIGKVQVAVGLGLKHQLHAQLLAARLQNVQQLFAPNTHKTVPARADGAALEQQLNVVPVVEGLLNLVGSGQVPGAHVVHRRVGKHHPPAKGVVGPVALHHPHPVRRVELFHQQPKVQAGRTTPNAHDVHGAPLGGTRPPQHPTRKMPRFAAFLNS